MRGLSLSLPSRQRAPLGRRAVALLFVFGIHLLLALLLLTLAPPDWHKPAGESVLKVFNVLPERAKPSPTPSPKRREQGAKPRAQVVVTLPNPDPPKLFGTELFEAVDITKLPNQREALAAAEGTGDSGTGADSETAYGPGGGPNGETLYNAQWQREPTHAEMAFYLPRGAPQGAWAIIACRTVEKFRVEDCAELGETPPGSGLARAVREASWQFRVRPPRVGGRVMVGAWVRIRFDFTTTGGV